jgi:hypothetical protein
MVKTKSVPVFFHGCQLAHKGSCPTSRKLFNTQSSQNLWCYAGTQVASSKIIFINIYQVLIYFLKIINLNYINFKNIRD